MPFQLRCPGCGRNLRVSEKLQGHTAPCPSCNTPIAVPVAKPISTESIQATANSEPKPENALGIEQHSLRKGFSGSPIRWIAAALCVAFALAIGVGLAVHTRPDSPSDGPSLADNRRTDGHQRTTVALPPPEEKSPVTVANKAKATATPQADDLHAKETLDLPTLIKRVESAVVRIDSDAGIGAGFLSQNDTMIFTNFHVINGAREATATFHDGSRVRILGVSALMPEFDLAALAIAKDTASRNPLVIADRLPEKGERVVAFGTPEGLSFSASEGIVSATRIAKEIGDSFLAGKGVEFMAAIGLNPESSWVQSSAPISHGSSGGPLVNMRGEVIGMNTLINADGQNLSFAISCSEIERLVDLSKSPSIPLALLAKPTKTPKTKVMQSERDGMNGLAGVTIAFGNISKEAADSGIGENEAQAFIERKLRAASIKVGKRDELGGPIGILELRIDTLPLDNGAILIYFVDCRLHRLVAVNPYCKERIELSLASVWNARARYGYAGRAVFGKTIRNTLDRLIDEFADAFLAINDK